VKRREAITLIGGIAAWPLAAHAQQPDRVRRIGVMMQLVESEPLSQLYVSTLTNRLRDFGWIEGRNLRVDYRWNTREPDSARAGAKELVALQADVIVAHGTASLVALRQETDTIPIVFTLVSEPVANGFVESLAHPSGNITGFSNLEASIGAKWVEMIKEIAPHVGRVAIIFNPDITPTAIAFAHSAEAAARQLSVEPVVAPVHGSSEIEVVITKLGNEPGGALILAPDASLFAQRKLIIELATRYRLPSIYSFPAFAADGGLLCYGPDPVDQFREAAAYVDQILRGKKPGDLPVQQPTKFELIINLKTAKSLGLTVPPSMLATADEVIE
jgi:putative tryptophan/tyrosine transport system substrate-binding protein